MLIKFPCIIYTYVYLCQRQKSHFISSPGGGGMFDVCLEGGRGMTNILLLFIKVELVYPNAVSRQTTIDIKCQ